MARPDATSKNRLKRVLELIERGRWFFHPPEVQEMRAAVASLNGEPRTGTVAKLVEVVENIDRFNRATSRPPRGPSPLDALVEERRPVVAERWAARVEAERRVEAADDALQRVRWGTPAEEVESLRSAREQAALDFEHADRAWMRAHAGLHSLLLSRDQWFATRDYEQNRISDAEPAKDPRAP